MFGLFKKKPAKPSREELIRQATANAAKARAEIGQENLDRIAKLLQDENRSEGLKARDEIRKMDQGKVADNLKDMMDDRK